MHAPLSDPGGTSCPVQLETTVLLSDGDDRVSSHYENLSRLHHAACMLPVYASRPRSPAHAQHSVPAADLLCRAGL